MSIRRSQRTSPLRALFLLGALLVVIFTVPLGVSEGGLDIVAKLVYTLVFCIGGYLLSSTRRWLVSYLCLAVPTLLVGVVASTLADVQILELLHSGMTLALQFLLIGAVLRFSLFNAEAEKLDRVIAGICGYLILGLLWSNIYEIQLQLNPESFVHSDGAAVSRDGGSLLYFSLVTLSTLGYGDITPETDWGRILAAMQAVAGTLYIAIFISTLVSGLKDRSPKK